MTGVWNGWFENGNQDYTGEYKEGSEDGVWEHFYENRQQELIETYFVKSRVSKNYLKDDELSVDCSYNEILVSVQEGPHYSWYSNGKPKDEGSYTDNIQDGEWIFYYETGNKMYQQTFVKGRINGKVTSWYAIGTLESEKNYKNFKPNGKWVCYEKQAGKVKQVIYFKDGVKVKK